MSVLSGFAAKNTITNNHTNNLTRHYSSYGNENEAPEEGALVEYCRLDKQKQPSVPRICDASTVISAKIRTPPLVAKSTKNSEKQQTAMFYART
ncbi:hypothetical protein ANCDUO_16096 [Ancylostoma duodenale]|uniref:Uncharacterized protein n=1 Tax=Ancylostoma duodenale TaxID=51022 RepID=A0A0C2G496_9BILA|nr:hypothetical protein ANCDUO_16096 [Ancylostoma duodenale]